MSQQRMEPVRIGVVGLGNFGRQHALTLAGLIEADLVALVARRQASLDAVREQLPGVAGWLDLRAGHRRVRCRGLGRGHFHAVARAASPATLLAAGKTVLLEKPVANNLAEAESLAPLVKPDSSNLMLGHIVLFNSEFLALADEVRRRGPLTHISCARHRPAANVAKFPGENPMHLTMVHDLYATLALVERGGADRLQLAGAPHARGRVRPGAGPAPLAGRPAWLRTRASFLTPAGMASNGFDLLEVFGQGWSARDRARIRGRSKSGTSGRVGRWPWRSEPTRAARPA